MDREEYRLRLGNWRVLFTADLNIIDFLSAFPEYKEDDAVPHEIVGLVIKKGYNLVKAWRVYPGKKQREVAKKAGITQAALPRMERAENPNRSATLEKLAAAMDISVELLRD